MEDKKRVFSAIQPTGAVTIGNYLGAIANWVELQKQHECYFAIADLHSLTLSLDGAILRKNVVDMLALLLACGIDDDKLFVQSHVPQHSQLAWVLNCYTQYGEASRMTQFKDKSTKHIGNINVGLFVYPILQAADILLYNTNFVPVGQDQVQHVELARDIAVRFNNRYSPTFELPEILVPRVGAKLFSLQDPTSKMSKSDDNINSFVLLTDDNDTILRKIRRAVTDSEDTISTGKGKEGISNLLTIYSAFEGITVDKAVQQLQGLNYVSFKDRVAQVVISKVQPIRQRYAQLLQDKQFLIDSMTKGAERAGMVARRVVSKVYKKVGLS